MVFLAPASVLAGGCNTEHHGLVEARQRRYSEEYESTKLIDDVPVSALGTGASQAVENGSFGVIQIGQRKDRLRDSPIFPPRGRRLSIWRAASDLQDRRPLNETKTLSAYSRLRSVSGSMLSWRSQGSSKIGNSPYFALRVIYSTEAQRQQLHS